MMLTIKQAAPKDIDRVLSLRQDLWSHISRNEHKEELERFFKDKNFIQFLAFDSDKIVGFCELSIKPHANGCSFSPVLFIEGVFVIPEMRRSGVAQQLIQKSEDYAKENNIPGLASDALIENETSHKAHLAWGFKEKERVVCYGKKL